MTHSCDTPAPIVSTIDLLLGKMGEEKNSSFTLEAIDGILSFKFSYVKNYPTRLTITGNHFKTYYCTLDEFRNGTFGIASRAHKISAAIWENVRNNVTRRVECEELQWSKQLNEEQQLQVSYKIELEKITQELEDKLFCIWKPVASGDDCDSANWTSGQSHDALIYFVHWVLIKAPVDKMDLFLTSDANILFEEINSNVNIYCTKDYEELDGKKCFYLQGFDYDRSFLESTQAFKARFLDRRAGCAVLK